MISINNEMGDNTRNKGKDRKSLENVHVNEISTAFDITVSVVQ